MPLTCRLCSRVNPAEALYCYHDGAALDLHGRDGPIAVGSRPFPTPFVFPSGRRCRSFDELVLACDDEWEEAKSLLRQGFVRGFLGGLGRADLAAAADRAARLPDPDRALDQLLGRLPATTREPPRLVVQPTEINLGELVRTDSYHFILRLENQGAGLLAGSVCCDQTDWLALGDPPGAPRKVFQFRHELSIPVQVVARNLRASDKPLEGRLAIETGGGTATVVVRMRVAALPFAEGVLAGARTPRELAAKARGAPKAAALLFEKGAVRAWYQANGWIYPVQGPSASGLGAVQQFFEALGLVQPPRVEVDGRAIQFEGEPGTELEHQLLVRTPEKRPVFAYGVADVWWLQIGRAVLAGQTARLPVRVPVVPDRPGESLRGQVQVTANGNQRFTVPVQLIVAGTPAAPADVLPMPESRGAEILPGVSAPPLLQYAVVGQSAEPQAEVVPAIPIAELLQDRPTAEMLPAEAPPRNGARRPPPAKEPEPWFPRGRHRLPLFLLGLALLVPVARDLGAWAVGAVDRAGLARDEEPRIALHFHDRPERVSLGETGAKPGAGTDHNRVTATWEPSMRFGLTTLVDPRGRKLLRPKRLTFEQRGLTNNAVVRLDGDEWIFGESPWRPDNPAVQVRTWPGRWLEREAPLGPKRDGRRSVWYYDPQRVAVTQAVEVVSGPQSGLLDTCLVRYTLENQDDKPHVVGLRFLLDTYIGGNDGVPFLIPGQRQLCTTGMDFLDPRTIPDFIQARETEDLDDPGTVAHLQLKLGGVVEAPGRVTLCAWPNARLEARPLRCLEEKTLWEVPVYPIHTLSPPDSAVVIYWNERPLRPGEKRELGFAYGLGNVAGGEGRGQLALTLGGSFTPEGEFTVTAYVKHPAPGQTVTLTLPEGFWLPEGRPQEPVPPVTPGASPISPVSWKVRAPRKPGNYTIRVESSSGVAQTQPVKIQTKGIFGSN